MLGQKFVEHNLLFMAPIRFPGNCPLEECPIRFHPRSVTHLAEGGGAALCDLRLQHPDELAQLHAVVQLLHEELRPHLLSWTRQSEKTR